MLMKLLCKFLGHDWEVIPPKEGYIFYTLKCRRCRREMYARGKE